MADFIDLNGLTFNFMKVIQRVENGKKRSGASWLCRCICGTQKVIRSEDLRSGKVKSCGCRKKSTHRLIILFDLKYSKKEIKGCWVWESYRDKDGIPQFANGRNARDFAYEINIGEIPKGMKVITSCRNPGCVNPKHLNLQN
jgi:hypothetical protein